MTPRNNIWFILGFSGAGKTNFSKFVAEKLSWLHVEIDQACLDPKEILRNDDLVRAYMEFASTLDASVFIRTLRDLSAASGTSGAIVSFRSNDVMPASAMRRIREYAAEAFYLVADARYCLRSFLNRERTTESRYSWQHWINNNANLLAMLSDPAMDEFTITTIDQSGLRKTNQAIYEDALNQVEPRKPV